jgi:hypothetical protein
MQWALVDYVDLLENAIRGNFGAIRDLRGLALAADSVKQERARENAKVAAMTAGTPEGEEYVVGPRHPAWKGLDDDDWNGSTFINWAHGLSGATVIISPSALHPVGTVIRMAAALQRMAKEVRIAWPHKVLT